MDDFIESELSNITKKTGGGNEMMMGGGAPDNSGGDFVDSEESPAIANAVGAAGVKKLSLKPFDIKRGTASGVKGVLGSKPALGGMSGYPPTSM